MKVLVIGATGGTGGHAVQRLLARGDEVTAFARDPSTLPAGERLRVARGDARDAGSLAEAVKGQDAVLSAFGPRSLARTDLQEVFMKNLVGAMLEHGPKRLVNLSAWGAGDSAPHSSFFFKRILRPTLLRHVFADKERGEEVLLASELDYVNVRPGRLLDSPARGGVRASVDGRGLEPILTRSDLAAFMVEQLTSDAWVRKSPLIGY